MGTKTDTLLIRLKVDGDGNVKASLAGVGDEVEGLGRKSDKTKVSAGGLQAAIAGIVTAGGLRLLLNANVEYQRLGAILKTVEGSSAAASKRFDQLKEFAKTTPFQLNEVVNAYVTLKNLGIDPTAKAMKAFGNISAGMGKDMQQVAEAVADATVGEFERLKEFGIKARKENDKISFSFRGTTTVVGDSSREIQEYLTEIGETEFAGAMADQMDTLGGKLSNLEDSFFNLMVAIGEAGASSIFGQFIGGLEAVTSDITAAIERSEGNSFTLRTQEIEEVNAQLVALTEEYDRLTQKLAEEAPSKLLDSLFFDAEKAEQRLKKTEQRLKSVVLQIKSLAPWQRFLLKERDDITDGSGEEAKKLEQSKDRAKELRKARIEAEKLIATLEKQIATFGMSRDEMVLYQAEAIATATTDKALAAQVREVSKALAEKIKIELAATEAERKHREEARKAREEQRAQEEAQQGLIEALRIVDPLRARAIERIEHHADVVDMLNEAEARGLITQAELRQYLEDLPELLEKAERGFFDFATEMELAIEDLSDAFAHLIIADDFKQGLDDLFDYFGDWLSDMGEEALNNAIKIVFEGVDGEGGIEGLLKGLLGKTSDNSKALSSQDSAVATAIAGLVVGSILGKEAGTGAAVGTRIGSAFGPIGAVIGGIIGTIVGLFSKKKTPRVTIGGQADGGERFSSALGGFSLGDTKRIGSGFDPESAAYQIVQAIMEFDMEIAKLLSAQERDIAELALAEFSRQYKGDNISGEQILKDRFRAIMDAVVPEFTRFITTLGDLEAQVEGFVAIRGIQKFAEDIDDLKDSLATDEITQFRIQIKQAREAEVSAMEAYNEALAAMDPTDIANSAQEAAQATIRRYQAEIQLVQQLTAMLAAGATQARKFTIEMETRKAALTGRDGPLRIALNQDLSTLRSAVRNEPDIEQALALLGEYIATLDHWLQVQRAHIERWLRGSLAVLDEREGAIVDRATQRQAEAEAARQAAIDEQTAALERQLGITESWVSVLAQAESLIDRLTLSSANPLSGPGRLAAIGDKISATRFALSRASVEDRPELAQKLIDLLSEQLSLAGDIYQRPSNEYVAIYNETIAQLNELRGMAAVGSASMEDLQRRLIDLQEQANEIALDQVQFTAEEQAQLDAIAARREELQEEANRRLTQLEARVLEGYQWAQTKGEALQERRQKEITDLLLEITGGLDPDSFIAQQQERTADLLEDIKIGLFAFLDEIRNGAVGPPGERPIEPGPPGQGRPFSDGSPTTAVEQPISVTVYSSVTVGEGGVGTITPAVEKAIDTAIMRSVPLIKEELKVA